MVESIIVGGPSVVKSAIALLVWYWYGFGAFLLCVLSTTEVEWNGRRYL